MRAAASTRRPPLRSAPTSSAGGGRPLWQAIPGFGAVFLLGYLLGIWAGQGSRAAAAEQLAAWYLDKQNFTVFPPLLTALLAAAALQLTLVLLGGLSAAGLALLTLFFGLRGGFLGLCAAGVYQSGGARSLVVYWLMGCLPDLAVLVVELWLSMYAAELAGSLFHEVFGSGAPRGALSGGVSRLVVRYLAALLLVVLFCALGAGLDLLLASVLL